MDCSVRLGLLGEVRLRNRISADFIKGAGISADFGWVESGFPDWARIVESGFIDSDSGGRINAE
jgi:hypothetical protein